MNWNSMLNLYYFLISFLSPDAQAKMLHNKVKHLVLDHQIARKTVDDARRKFEAKKEYTIKNFQDKKKTTLEKTHAAIKNMQESVLKEEEEVKKEFEKAQAAIVSKKEVCNMITGVCNNLDIQEFKVD